ncbi:MAG: hemerythrin domain-containing protein [Tepidimonas sp.]|nr:hemerythrin domain-containing protein [Tepidimonas sp.]
MTSGSPNGEVASPIADFSQCHAGIVRRLDALAELPALLAPAARAQAIAQTSLEFFREAIFEHHLDEERELFPAVLASAEAAAEHARVQALARRLTDEHRELETLWKRLEPGLKKVAKGQAFDELDIDGLQTLVQRYRAHAQYEENEFLPLAQTILARNGDHMAALGLALHLRHSRTTTPPYV